MSEHHHPYRSSALLVCYACTQGNHQGAKEFLDSINHMAAPEAMYICHCNKEGCVHKTMCTADHAAKKVRTPIKNPNRFAGSTSTEMGF